MATTNDNDEKTKRTDHKKEAKQSKKQKIQENGGTRPRTTNPNNKSEQKHKKTKPLYQKKKAKLDNNVSGSSTHRFGKVMLDTPKANKPRNYTLSIAIPGSFVSNAVTLELSTYLVGQIARASTIYNVDEIIIYNDHLSISKGLPFRRRRNRHDKEGEEENKPSTPEIFLSKLLEYCECPQYLRRDFFPFHPDFQFVGILPPLDAPHHVRETDTHSRFREGVVLTTKSSTGMSMVHVGFKKPIEIDRVLTPGIRVTIEFEITPTTSTEHKKGKVVSPSKPREFDGTYWGYTTRLAGSFQAIFDECPYNDEKGYDVKIGTSERGNVSIDDDKNFVLPKKESQHLLVVFGGVAGIEECVDADESLKISGEDSHKMFDYWVNTCPLQGSRTIRTEEAVLLTLARLNPFIEKSTTAATSDKTTPEVIDSKSNDAVVVPENEAVASKIIEFSDASMSEESSDSD